MTILSHDGKPRQTSLDTPEDRAHRKARLVDLGLQALARDEWFMVWAITAILRKRGWSHD